MRNNRRTWKRSTALLMTLAMVLSLPTGITIPRQAQAADYGLNNPTTDSNGVTTWDCVYFGNYWQNDTNGDGVADENDEKQPIKWRVLSVDGDNAFLLADQNLDIGLYNESYRDATWETCTMRSWLNGYGASSNVDSIDYSDDNFIDAAFTSAEQNVIRQVTVANEDNPNYGTEGGNVTNDKVYLLSIEEASNALYGFNSTFDTDSDTRVATNTAYVAGNIVMNGVGEGDSWWLCSPGDSGYGASIVGYNGYGYYGDYAVWHEYNAVRPVLHLNLSSANLWSYAGTVSAEGGSVSVATPTPTAGSTKEKNADDVAALEKLITEQKAQGASVSEDLDDEQYEWYDGRLVEIYWGACGLSGEISFSGLTALQSLYCYDNDISNLDVSKNTSLEMFNCGETKISNLDVSTNTALTDLFCYGTNLSSLDVSHNIALKVLECEYTKIDSLDVSANTVLTELHCYNTNISSLDVSHNKVLNTLCCYDTNITRLDIRNNTELENLDCDEDVVVIRTGTDITDDPTPTIEPGTTPSAQPTVSPSMTPVPTSSVAQDTKGTPTPTASSGMTPASSTTPSNTKATLSPATVGTTIKDKTASYKVVSADKKQPAVAYTKAIKKNASSVIVPDKIKVNGVTYQVKSIAPKAFANNKKLKKITIGKNITSIGKQAFAGCKKLKKITIKSAKLKSSSIGKNAFKGTAKKLTVKVPKKKYKAYKKFLKKKGNKTVKVTK